MYAFSDVMHLFTLAGLRDFPVRLAFFRSFNGTQSKYWRNSYATKAETRHGSSSNSSGAMVFRHWLI
jgi:hypothetical protein